MYRLGNLLLFIGLFLLALYLLSDVAGAPSIKYLAAGSLIAVLGGWLRLTHRPMKAESSRFQGIRKLASRPEREPGKGKDPAEQTGENKKTRE